MSIRIMSWVWENGPKSGTDTLVLLALADFCDDAGRCFPSVKSIAEKARMTERGAQKIIRRMEAEGWLSIATGGGRYGCNHYQINQKRVNSIHPEPCSPPERESTKPRTAKQETLNRRSPEPSVTINEPSLFGDDAPKPKRRRPETDLPEGWVPSDRNIQDAEAKGFTAQEINDEGDRFRDFHAARGSRFRDWDAAWRTWLGNARKFSARGGMAGKASPNGYGRGSSIASIVARRHAQGQN